MARFTSCFGGAVGLMGLDIVAKGEAALNRG
jgi:hypothetical protein